MFEVDIDAELARLGMPARGAVSVCCRLVAPTTAISLESTAAQRAASMAVSEKFADDGES
ncbi:hypothetical protein ACIBJI_33310 [Nocardia sp. NPDC050408]|uniref:hypothetical protein n=1 Tax=unclassified Nocardia TaxID=2637762 RepID=UPI0034152DD6